MFNTNSYSRQSVATAAQRTVNEDDTTAAVKIIEGKQNMNLKRDLCDYSCKKKNNDEEAHENKAQ